MNLSQLKKSQLVPPQQHQHPFKVLHTEPKDKEKPLFQSKVQRFAGNHQDTPGPGTYDSNVRQKHTIDYRVVRDKKSEGEIANQHQWIFSNGRMSLPNGTGKYVGPGLYYPELFTSDSSHSNWAKNQRFNDSKSFKNSIGPGQYDSCEASLPKKEKNTQLSVFKSKAPRTFFEELILKEKKLVKKQNPEDEDNEPQEVVKFDETIYPLRKKVEKLSPVFLSKCTRPQLINDNSPQRIGPGSYSLSLERAISQKNTGILSAMHYNIAPLMEKKTEVLTSKITPPGPGAYHQSASTEALSKKPLGIIPREERFKANTTHIYSQIPGPGQYMQKRYTMIKEDEFMFKAKNCFARKCEKSHDFGTVARATLKNHSDAPFGQYNVQIFDMNYKIKKQKEHYQKLKMMEVTLPAFNSKSHHQ